MKLGENLRMELKKIEILSVAKIAGLFGIISGLFLGIFSMIYTRLLLNKFPTIAQQFNVTQVTGINSVFLLIVLYGVIYFIIGVLCAFIYNLLANWVGGVKLEFKGQKETGKKK